MTENKNRVKTISYDFDSPKFAELIPVPGELFNEGDLGHKPAAKPVPTFSSLTACARCGQMFAAVVRRGRPERYCSDPCRHAEAYSQRRGWGVNARNDPEDRPTHCQQCGAPLVVKSDKAGRFKRFCSTRCFVKSREPPRRPDLLDLACINPENETRQEPKGHETQANNRRK